VTLKEYLEAKELKPSQFAASIGVEPSTIIRMANGERGPSLAMALRIETETDGAVTVQDWPSKSEPEQARAAS
jgi:plasmid maintenance system antidote protein VapI